MERTHFILFIDDQARSREFYSFVLEKEPILDVLGMTEFELPGGGVLGLMPSQGITKLLGPALPDPAAANAVSKAELYLESAIAEAMFERALSAGATPLSLFQERDWGHSAAYCLDPDGHVVAMAKEISQKTAKPDDTAIVTKRLRLRPFQLSDAQDVQRLAGDKRIAEMTAAIPHPYDDGMAEAWIAGHAEEIHLGQGFHWAVTLKQNDALIGAISLMDVDDEVSQAELGYWIAVDYWNRGYASEAATAVVAWAFCSLGLNRVHAHHFGRNPASGAVLKNIGMQHEGSRPQHFARWGRHEDVELYGILKSDWRS